MKAKCPNCRQEYELGEDERGNTFTCIECGQDFRVGDIPPPVLEPVLTPVFPADASGGVASASSAETSPSVGTAMKKGTGKSRAWIWIALGVTVAAVVSASLFFAIKKDRPGRDSAETEEKSATVKEDAPSSAPAAVSADVLKYRELKKLIAAKDYAGLSSRLGQADLEFVDESGLPLLSAAVDTGSLEIVRLLLANDINLNQEDKDGVTPLYHAASGGFSGLVELLLSKGAEPDGGRYGADKPLGIAAAKGDLKLVQLLLARKASPFGYTAKVGSPLLRAFRSGYPDCARELLAVNANVSETDEDGNTILILAVERNSSDLLKLALDNYAVADALNLKGDTALFLAIRGKKVELAEMLLKAGARTDLRDKGGRTPLMMAAEAGLPVLVASLLTDKNLNERDSAGRNALFYAVQGGDKSVVECLLAKGAEITAGTLEHTPLYAALKKKDTALVVKFLKTGMDLKQQDSNGNTPLMIAAECGDINAVQFMVKQKADLLHQNKAKKNSLDLAVENGHERIVSLLSPLTKAEKKKQVRREVAVIVDRASRMPPARGMAALKELVEKYPGFSETAPASALYEKLRKEESVRAERGITSAIEEAKKIDSYDKAIALLETAIKLHPAAPNLSLAKSHLEKYKEAKRLAVERAKRRQAQLARLSRMSKAEVRREVNEFIDAWLKDMQLDNDTSKYWDSSSDASTLFSVRSWRILGVSGRDGYSPVANIVIVNIQSSTKGGYAINKSWKVGILRDDDMKWKIHVLTDKD